MNRIIKWEWWKNPLGGEREFVDEEELEQGEHEDEEDVGESRVRVVVPTAMGLVPVHAYGSFSENFNFWMMHTNFNLTPGVVETLEKVPGVETCDVLSRYRARIGFGRCFESGEVKAAIQEALLVQPPVPPPAPSPNDFYSGLDSELKQRVVVLEQTARSLYKHWAIYVIPNGEIEFVHSEDEKEYARRIEILRQSQALAGGKILSSNG